MFTKRAKVAYALGATLYLLALGFLLTRHQTAGLILLALAVGITTGTAQANGHLDMPKWWGK